MHGAAAGAGAAVPAGGRSAPPRVSCRPAGGGPARSAQRVRWVVYVARRGRGGGHRRAVLVLVLLGCGLIEIVPFRGSPPSARAGRRPLVVPAAASTPVVAGGLGALAWVAFKVGALSYGGGFVIIPLMQHDAVTTYHWMTAAQFLNAVALGQITPGPVVQTVAVVGYAAGGLGGGLLAALVAFAPSFLFVIAGAPHFDRLRTNARVQAFLTGAGPAAIGAIAGSAIPLGRELAHVWQLGILVLAAIWLLGFRRGVVLALVAAGVLGVIAVMAGAPA